MTTDYPPPGCGDGPNCKACIAAGFVFPCARCGLSVSWCYGADDDQPDWCDGCWAVVYGSAIAKVEGTP
jgi:hypothetical protein